MRLSTLSRSSSRSGMNMINLLVAMMLSSIVFLALMQLVSYTSKSFASIYNYVDLDKDSRNALDKISQEIRQADKVISYNTNQLILTNVSPSKIISYTFNPSTQVLWRTNGTQVEMLLTNCESFAFTFWTDVTKTNSWDQWSASTTNDLKMIQFAWRCYRTMLGRKNTESIQSAKIMIRKQ